MASWNLKVKSFWHSLLYSYSALRVETAIITGAGSGLGMEIAKGFAMSGADVALVDRNLEPVKELADELANAGFRALAVKADVTSSEQVNRL